ncbi:MAG: PAS-domain containing protein, partial [Rhodobacterales bacterium]|nr:PAS-domain containing protein [Rhodobacterales bacterium]
MDLINQPQIGSAILAGALAGSVVLALLMLIDYRRWKAAAESHQPDPRDAETDAAAFLFRDGRLLQFTEAAEIFLQNLPDPLPPEDGGDEPGDWAVLRGALKDRYPDLPDLTDLSGACGKQVLHAAQPDDPGQLSLEWWDGHVRLTLNEPTPALIKASPLTPVTGEAEWLRQAVTGAPYPIWQSGRTGQVLWANAAYMDLVARFTTDPQPEAGCPAIFDIPYHDDGDSTTYRMSVMPPGSVQPYWFDVRSLRLDTGWMNYATDVNAVVNAEIAQRNFVQTLTKTFAQLSIGLAIFDRKRQLALFNPALIDLISLPAEFLSARPNLLSFFDRLRDRQIMPEPKNYRSWRDQIADLVAAADNGQYLETWSLPSGLTYRVSGRPHPDGAVA